MKRLAKVLALVMAVAALLTACGEKKPDGAVAKVNGEYITREAFDKEYGLFKKMLYGSVSEEDFNKVNEQGTSLKADLEKRITDVMIMDRIVDGEIKKNKIEITDEQKTEEKAKMAERLGGEEKFKEQMEKEGITEEELDYIVAKGLKQTKLKEWYMEQNKPSDEDVQKYFEEHKDELVKYDVAHILVDTEEEANEIKKQLAEGKDFGEIAKEKSKDESSAVNGGNLGEISLNVPFVAEFLEAMKTLKAGEISDPVKTQFGYHIIHVKSISDNLDDLKEGIEARIMEPKFQEYINELYKNSEVEIYKSKATAPQEQKTDEQKSEEPKSEEQKPETEKDKPVEGEKPEDKKDNK